MKTWYDANYVIEKYNEVAGRNSHHEKVAMEFKRMLDEAEKKIAIQDAELALAKELRERRKAESEPEMIC